MRYMRFPRRLAALGGGGAFLGVFWWVSAHREPDVYRPRFVGHGTLIERHRTRNDYEFDAPLDVYRFRSKYADAFRTASDELTTAGWRLKARKATSAVWVRPGPDGDSHLSIGDVRDLEARSGRRTSAPQDGQPYVLVLVAGSSRRVSAWERLVTQGPKAFFEDRER